MDDNFASGYAIGSNDARCSGGGDGMGAWGAWLIPLLLLALLFGGGMGFGGFGGGFGGGYGLQGMATRADINAGFQFNNIENGIRGIQQGICDSTYALNNAINGVQGSLCQGFNGVERGFAQLGYQLSDCCCQTQRLIERGFADTGYAVQSGFNAVVQNSHADTDRVIAKLDAMERDRLTEKLDALRSENQTLRFAASQSEQNSFIAANQQAQTAELIRRLGLDCPQPAYLVNAPTPVSFPVDACGRVQFGGNCGNSFCCGRNC